MIHLKAITFQEKDHHYPYDLPFFDQKITFNKPITILVGDNGCGKSTFLELIQEELELYQIGKPIEKHPHVSCIKETSLKKPKGFYFSSEDFTTYIKELENELKSSKEELEHIDKTYSHRSPLAKSLAKMPHARTIHEISSLHDRPLNHSSHGEAYLSFFKSRMRDNQLILLDEPETPLSFSNQLALLYILKDTIDRGSQVIIATHSPIIMAFPDAEIYLFNHDRLEMVQYDDLESIKILKDFLNDPNRYLHHLFFNHEDL